MKTTSRGISIALITLAFGHQAAAEWRCDCTSIVGSCQAAATVGDSFIEVTSNNAQCARVDYFVDGIPFVALVVDGVERQDWIARSESPSIIVQSCQVCVDNADSSAAAGAVATGANGGEQAEETARLIEVAPVYPAAAAAAGTEGYVDVRVSLTPSGEVMTAEVVEAEPAGVFDQAALQAVTRWRYTRSTTEESRTLTERVTFSIDDAILALNARPARQAAANQPVARDVSFNSCVREEASYDFGAMVDVSLINACSDTLIVYSCASGVGSQAQKWICRDPEQTATLLASSRANPSAADVSVSTPAGARTFAALGNLELTRAPNSEYWWLACRVDDTVCRNEGREWVRS
ncbi:MAG: energy transducer TonB, partial [Gammaproteobacteria bacterium]|nr:energy transducer TonB [Gammaproteobacteria bacterium]